MPTTIHEVMGEMTKMTVDFDGDGSRACAESLAEALRRFGADATVTFVQDTAHVVCDDVSCADLAEMAARCAHNAREAGRIPAQLYSVSMCAEFGKPYSELTWRELEDLVGRRTYRSVQDEAQLYRIVTPVGGKSEEKTVDHRTLMRRMDVVREHDGEFDENDLALGLLNSSWE